MTIHPGLSKNDMLVAQLSDKHWDRQLEMITNSHMNIKSVGNGLLTDLAIESTKVARFGERNRNNI